MAQSERKERVLLLLKRLGRLHALAQRCTESLHRAFRDWGVLGMTEGSLANLLGPLVDTKVFADLCSTPWRVLPDPCSYVGADCLATCSS